MSRRELRSKLEVLGDPERKTRRAGFRLRPQLSGLEHRTMLSPVPTSTAVAPSTWTAFYGQPVRFTVTVSPVPPASGTPTGTVTVYDGTTVLGSATLSHGTAVLFRGQ
jgi:Bacterial Ig-like domain (group 3)